MDSSEVLELQQETEVQEDGTGADVEDIPSDFFDEFNKEEFIEGLSIIDSWVDGIHDSDRAYSKVSGSASNLDDVSSVSDNTYTKKKKVKYSRSPRPDIGSQLDEFIRPGSRRDPSKTNEAIKKDKEVKLKEFLAKSLESSDDLRPPGTELDGYFDEAKHPKKDKTPIKEKENTSGSHGRSRSRERRGRDSPVRSSNRARDSPFKSSYRQRQWSPRRSPKRSPRRYSPQRRSPLPYRRPYQQWRPNSPQVHNFRPGREDKVFPRRHWSPNRRSPRRSDPRRFSPRRSPRRSPHRPRRSRSHSPYKPSRRSRSPLHQKSSDRFLFPADPALSPSYASTGGTYAPSSAFPGPNYSYGPDYSYNNSTYQYGNLPPPQPGGVVPPQIVPGPQPSAPGPLLHMVPVPHIPPNPVPVPHIPPNPVPAPVMVPAPNLLSPSLPKSAPTVPPTPPINTPCDPLAKLVAEGKISQADYLKLAPNKGASNPNDVDNRSLVLQRCSSAVLKLNQLHLPNHLIMNNMLGGQGDAKFIAPPYCSPLKRQAPIEFLFTKANVSAMAQQNKHLVDSIIACLPELQKTITRPKKKLQKNMKDAAVQTSKPFCDVCEIRENTQFNEASTYIDSEHFSSSVHTQVMDQDLINSKSVFTPSGGASDGAQMSIAHLTPAQLVSQLAARAKTLKQTDFPANHYPRNPSNSFDYEGRGGQQYQNYNNYRY